MLLDPLGRTITPSKRRIRFDQPALAKVVAMADDVFRKLELTVVCVHCGGTPQAGNHRNDVLWKLECGCTERVLVNPEPRSTH